MSPKSTSHRSFCLMALLTLLAHAYLLNAPLLAAENTMVEPLVSPVGCTPQQEQQQLNMTPRDMTGSWVGSWWIPPKGWKLFSTEELQDMWIDQSMIWVGDSTARRSAMSLYGLLRHDNNRGRQEHKEHLHVSLEEIDREALIDLNRKEITEPCRRHGWDNNNNNNTKHLPLICRPMPENRNKDFVVLQLPCLQTVENFLLDEVSGASNLTIDMDVMILSLGIWDVVRQGDCQKKQGGRPLRARILYTLDALTKLNQKRPKLKIIWRTSGYSFPLQDDESEHDEVNQTNVMNDIVMDHLDKQQQLSAEKATTTITNHNHWMTYVNWGGAVEPRSFGANNRLAGDIPAHYGIQPRLVLHQMIANTMYQRALSSRLPPPC
ncbi:expressed unknown protein [Seminavis robusta]|uniref:Uncharacterized protein n=1 Tax=Seminavis robusta TaxID=568900 RepID=A0A9N8EZH3_9STRA|nr:expressed unknown protein [Seminavis robusta]|eukprot:Sro2097_g314350.1 n/a (378) ;mRNA; f:14319-15452